MFGWSKTRKRKQALAEVVTSAEMEELESVLWQTRLLTQEQNEYLARWIRVFVAEKHWEGCNGLRLTPAIKKSVAAFAGLMVLAYPGWYFDRTETILVYPRPYVAKESKSFGSGGLVGDQARAGETTYRGPVIVNWNDIRRAQLRPDAGHNIVIHEFAHQLDFINGPAADGLPPLPHTVDERAWMNDFTAQHRAAEEIVASGEQVLIDDYGLTSLSEFFAVSSELYFQTPEELFYYHPGVFDLLKAFYQIDLRTGST
jgi:MtfA peptidase